MKNKLTKEEKEALEGFEDTTLQFYRVTMNLRADVQDWLKEKAMQRTKERGHKVGYQNVIQEELIRLMQQDRLLSQSLKQDKTYKKIADILESVSVANIISTIEKSGRET